VNHGLADAQDVNVDIRDHDGNPCGDQAGWWRLPIPDLYVGQEIHLGYVITIGMPVDYRVEVTWRDRRRGTHEQVVWCSIRQRVD
jgi:hypothetical protein